MLVITMDITTTMINITTIATVTTHLFQVAIIIIPIPVVIIMMLKEWFVYQDHKV